MTGFGRVGPASAARLRLRDAFRYAEKRTGVLMVSNAIRLEERDAPVVLEADVVVVGGGSAGLAAAIAAAQLGARTSSAAASRSGGRRA